MLKRNLEARHLNMIALGGSIGTGLFLTIGYAISVAGPGGALLAYMLIAIMVYFLITSLGEMATHRPTTGSFCEYSSDYVSKPFGFAMSYNYWLNWTITIATEIVAATLVLKFWFPEANDFLVSSSFFFLIVFINAFSVKIYGETEYWMSFVKVATIIVFIVLCIVMIAGTTDFGIANFTTGDAPFHDGWHGFILVFLVAGFSFQGSELIGISAGETKNPKKNIPKAVKQVFWRLLLFYLLTTLMIGLLIPYNDPSLIKDSVEASPFTVVFQEYFGLGFATNFINFVILVAIITAGNASLFASSRTLWHMGNTGQAPKIFSKISSHGLPYWSFVATAFVGFLVFLFSYFFSENIFEALVGVSSLFGFIAWFGIALSHYYFRKKYLKGDTSKLKYKAKLFPIAPILSMIFIMIIILGQSLPLFDDFSITMFIQSFGGVFLFIAMIFTALIINKLQSNKIKKEK